ncbi:alpha-hydroxy acid oxidase [Ilumatobacter sp.]|uniref:alpha-hydroxy acid oxidase n=1 Tax=Ilumatobacter sp. TaxID=1967498 RepID=UPI003AF4E133
MYDTFRSTVRFRKFEADPVERRLRTAVTVEDLRRVAKRRLPRGVFDYIDGGAEDERTMANNAGGFARLEFRPNVLRDVSAIDTHTTILGHHVPLPLILAPTGYSRIADPQGELAVARASARAGVPYSLSTMSTRTIEEVSAVSDGPKWFQVYTWKDRGLVKELVERAADAGYEALWLTVDTAVLGRRERDVRNGYAFPPELGPKTIVDGILHPAWTLNFLRNEPMVFANVAHHAEHGTRDAIPMAEHVMKNFDQRLSWADVEWLQSIWDGPIILKGIQTVDDARRAVAAGVQGIGLSNHGGRQLDGAPAPIELVEPVAQEIQGAAAVICDGGIRRGSDIVKAIALGADACSIGRPYLYGLGAGGERGVDHVLRFFREGVERTMALTGRTSIAEIDRDLVRWRDR